jgi:hypothetical protein
VDPRYGRDDASTSLRRHRRMVANSVIASARRWGLRRAGRHQPIDGGVQDEPYLIDELRAGAGPVRDDLCILIRFSA